MAGRIGGKADRGNGVGGIEIDGLDLGEGGKVVGFSVEGRSLFGGGRETPAKESARWLFQCYAWTYCTRTLSCISHL